MKIEKSNIFNIGQSATKSLEQEIFEVIFSADVKGKLEIKRIISTGQATPNNEWYDQEDSEWVVLLRGESTLRFQDCEDEFIDLKDGDYIYIPAHVKHRVESTSVDAPCIWLAVHHQKQ